MIRLPLARLAVLFCASVYVLGLMLIGRALGTAAMVVVLLGGAAVAGAVSAEIVKPETPRPSVRLKR